MDSHLHESKYTHYSSRGVQRLLLIRFAVRTILCRPVSLATFTFNIKIITNKRQISEHMHIALSGAGCMREWDCETLMSRPETKPFRARLLPSQGWTIFILTYTPIQVSFLCVFAAAERPLHFSFHLFFIFRTGTCTRFIFECYRLTSNLQQSWYHFSIFLFWIGIWIIRL